MKIHIRILILSLAIVLAPLSAALATFPGKSIAHWDASISNELQDPGYQKLHHLVDEKKYTEALDLLDQKIKSSPKEGTAVILKGLLLNEMSRYKEALKFLKEGQNLQPRHPSLHYGYCQVYRNLGNGELSKRGCQIAVEQHYQAPETHYEYAQTLSALGKMEQANRELKIAAGLDPKNPRYPFERGMIFYYLNQPGEAEKSFLKTLALDETHIDAAYQIAYLYAAQGKTGLAEPYLHRILMIPQKHPKVESAKRLLKYLHQDTPQKLPLKIEPHAYHLGRSQSLYQSGKYGLSLIEIQTASRLKPDDLKTQEILIGLGSILLRLDLTEQALDRFIQLAGKDDTLKAKGYQEMGDIRVIQGKLNEARQYYEKAKSLGDPGNLARISLKEFPSEEDSRPSPFNPKELFIKPTAALNRKGEIFAYYQMYDRAIAIYSMVIGMDPNFLESILNTATAYYNKGNNGRAISILERLLVLHPNHKNILAHRLLLAQAYAKNGDLADSLKSLEIIVKINPSTKKLIQSNPVFNNLKDMEGYKNLIH
ncbi:MAG: tetratricopeptide repeat protein [Nitrospinaceae bacterium]